jgi:hypothetical protein
MIDEGTISFLLDPRKGIIHAFSFCLREAEVVTESQYQAGLIKRLKKRFRGCEILKNDPSYRQGILDLTIFYGPCWATLEVKASASAAERPNQAYYVEKLNNMSFAAFIFPENEEEVLTALQEAFASRGTACVS